ncbi:hypothetical protein IV203_021671 [Nitzschia inconspicua]|uniref:Uncharacterized protein n=1 Tax=Nitzschia inconspicua TaxID=303405 RepID=A0A9K3K567_9STRA|nr:hypothetical protein IV203_022775 [Nitzschia inconspicua]KAG7343663.1 hypothetical protein IV203_021671 [Nitzschia inconspicua]
MAIKKKNTNTTASNKKTRDKPPPLDEWIKPAIGIVLALLGYQFFRGMVQQEISRINLDDELELRQVLFGEVIEEGVMAENYAVLCHPETATYPISSVFHDAAKDGSAPAVFRVMDCDTVMAGSDKTVKERFAKQLNDKIRPMVFVSGKTGPPKQVPAKHLKTGSMLVKALKNLLTPKAEKIETTQDLRTKCLDKDICALLLKGSKTSPNYVKSAMEKLLVEFPKVAFAAVDTSVLYVMGLEAEYLPEFQSDVPRFAVFQKVSGTADKSKTDGSNSTRLKTSVTTLEGSLGYGPMSNLIASVVQKTATMQKVSSLPTIKTRSKKLEEEERQKRQRRQEQQQRRSSSNSDTGGGGSGYFSSSSSDNDGTADGRRAERERRRAEHRANNPNYKEKTPEEIAEIERRRRQRMEEEAQKWNVAPEDAPEEGEPFLEGGGQDEDFEDGSSSNSRAYEDNWDSNDLDSGDQQQQGADDDDEEDVMDLD